MHRKTGAIWPPHISRLMGAGLLLMMLFASTGGLTHAAGSGSTPNLNGTNVVAAPAAAHLRPGHPGTPARHPAPGAPSGPPGSPAARPLFGACPMEGTVVPTENPSGSTNYFNDVAAVSANNLWSVGTFYDAVAGTNQTLVEQWDGTAWAVVASPNVTAAIGNELYAVATVSANDIWAVGVSNILNPNTKGQVSHYETLIEHWNGSTWSVVPSVNLGTNTFSSNYLYGISAVSATDVWAVGQYYDSATATNRTLVEHWDGTAWAVVASPNVAGTNSQLYSVTAVSANDVWAVGELFNSATGTHQTLVEHWGGRIWSIIASPDVVGSDDYFSEVTAITANDVWAVGSSWDASSIDQTLIEHWDGTAWTIVPSANIGTDTNDLYGISAVSATDVWAAGYYYDTTTGADQTLVEHWDGTAWTAVLSPNGGTSYDAIYSVVAVSAIDVWAVGETAISTDAPNGLPTGTLAIQFVAVCPTPTVTPTEPPATATATSTATETATETATALPTETATALPTETATALPNSTATATPQPSETVAPSVTSTPCALTFSDVHPSDFFAISVQYLACHGVIHGYPDGNFRPGNNTIRAQMIKIVVLGFAQPLVTPAAGGYTFADVLPGFSAFTVIETAAAHNIIVGYPCGGPFEPCDAQHRPYFRPNNNVSRGQLVKMTTLAAGMTNPVPPTQQTFEDVLPTSPFWVYIEQVAPLNVISGYPCGTSPAGPCVAPGNRPYFAPGTNVTRGQTTKIVYNTLLLSLGQPPRP